MDLPCRTSCVRARPARIAKKAKILIPINSDSSYLKKWWGFREFTLRRVSVLKIWKNQTSKELRRLNDSIPYLDNAKLFFLSIFNNEIRLSYCFLSNEILIIFL